MFEKYFKLIKESQDKKVLIQEFLSNRIGLNDFNFDIVGRGLKVECSSQDRFILKLKESELKEFLKENNLFLK